MAEVLGMDPERGKLTLGDSSEAEDAIGTYLGAGLTRVHAGPSAQALLAASGTVGGYVVGGRHAPAPPVIYKRPQR